MRNPSACGAGWEMLLASSGHPRGAETCPAAACLMQAYGQEAEATAIHRCLGYRWCAVFYKIPKEGCHLHLEVCVCTNLCLYVVAW